MQKAFASAIFSTILLAGITFALTAISTETPQCAHTADIFVRFDAPIYQQIIEENADILPFLNFNEVKFKNNNVEITRNDGKMLLRYKSNADLKAFLGCN